MKILLTLFIGVFLIGIVGAVNECGNDNSFLGTFKQNQTITLKQTCDTCTYTNLSSVNYPNSTTINYNTAMTKNGIEYNSTSTDTKAIGCYSYVVFGDKDGTLTSETIDYLVTPSGLSDLLGLRFYLVVLIVSVLVMALGFWIKDGWIVIFGTFGLYFLAIYTMINGIVGVRDMIVTWAIALIMLGIAGYISIRSGIEMIRD